MEPESGGFMELRFSSLRPMNIGPGAGPPSFLHRPATASGISHKERIASKEAPAHEWAQDIDRE